MSASTPAPYSARFEAMDGLRGVAAFMVLLWHIYWYQTTAANGLWLGVQFFFVISGYCIAAAVTSARSRDLPFKTFMMRRMWRIGVPYLGSLLVTAVAWLLVFAMDGHVATGLSGLRHDPVYWVSNFTMTQWTYLTEAWLATGTGLPTPWYNPRLFSVVHWSLNYEEQFYLLAGLVLVLGRHGRPALAVGALTAGVFVINVLFPGRITGLFPDYWLQFFCGVLVFLRLQTARSIARHVADVAMFLGLGAVCALAWLRGEYPVSPDAIQFYAQLSVCMAFGGFLILLRPWDAKVMGTGPARLLSGLGAFSYSLYLVHRPALDVFVRIFKSFPDVPMSISSPLIIPLVLLCAYGFYRVFEKPFLNPPLPAHVPAPVVPIVVTELA